MFREYFFDHRTLIVAGLILACVVVYAFKCRPKGARPKYDLIGHFLLGLGMAGFYVGATEGILGAFLSFSKVPPDHLALVVAAFRVVTFWIWIPLGWLALAVTRRRTERRARRVREVEERTRRRLAARGAASSEPISAKGLPADVDGS